MLLIAALGALWLHRQLRASLPPLDGEVSLPGLAAPVEVARDALGVPEIRGQDRVDVARALGFLHGQDRFFQMDLIRRRAAGELAELLGANLLTADRRFRVHRFRARAEQVMARWPRAERKLAEAYAAGVNAGLRGLSAPPFEYLVLRAKPELWQPEDILLAAYSMYFDLNDEMGRFESARGLVFDILGPEMYRFLFPLGTEWDAPIVGEPFPTPPIPGPEVLDLRLRQAAAGPSMLPEPRHTSVDVLAASNNWAVAGRLTPHRGAILANDMHLGLSVPNIWYRASMIYPDPDAPDGERHVSGATLPGTPFLIVGSNEQVAWGYTNTWGDWEDLVIIEPAPEGSDAYLAPGGPRRFVRQQEILRVRGGEDRTLEVLETIWGPVIDEDHRGRRRALRWIAHDPRAVSFALLEFERAGDVEEAVAAANRVGAPPQNFVVADADGRIAWTVMGPLPRRIGHDGQLPASWADGSRRWDGWLAPEEYPRVVDPPSGRIWTANNRVVGGEMMAKIGGRGYRLGARARQIRDHLRALESSAERDHLGVQLDDRALFLERWRQVLLELLRRERAQDTPQRRELRRLVESWGGRASTDSAGYRLVRAFRLFVAEQVLGAITADCKRADQRFDFSQMMQYEGPLWRLITERPEHLLDARFESWDEQLQAAMEATLSYFLNPQTNLGTRTWGERNTAAIRHPLSPAMPFAARWLDMPSEPLAGDSHMPRFQAPDEGASQRMVVSPGREDAGIFHMPTGQSGHPLSPHYRDGHAAWVRGDATPLLPGPARHLLTLRPPAGG